jgi:hypothetical protein
MHWRTAAGLIPIFLLTGMSPRGFGNDFARSDNPDLGWQLTSGKADVAIYTRPHPGSSLNEFKGVATIDAPTYAVQAVIDDFENYPKFMPYVTECHVIKRDSDSIVGYQRVSPKICADRDFTLRVWKKSWPALGGLVFMSHWAPANESGPPENKGVVRIKLCYGKWLLEPDGAGKTHATYSVYSDSGGMIPPFLANNVGKMGVKRLFEALRKQVKDPKYTASNH